MKSEDRNGSDTHTLGLTRRDFLGVVAAAALAATGPEFAFAASPAKSDPTETALREGWLIQSSAEVRDKGGVISTADYSAKNWYSVSVPTTVLAGLVANGEYPDIFVGDNLSRVPTHRFAASWWYRTEFGWPAGSLQTWLYFKGINYRTTSGLMGSRLPRRTGSSELIAILN